MNLSLHELELIDEALYKLEDTLGKELAMYGDMPKYERVCRLRERVDYHIEAKKDRLLDVEAMAWL